VPFAVPTTTSRKSENFAIPPTVLISDGGKSMLVPDRFREIILIALTFGVVILGGILK
jgi:hypothetical protein